MSRPTSIRAQAIFGFSKKWKIIILFNGLRTKKNLTIFDVACHMLVLIPTACDLH